MIGRRIPRPGRRCMAIVAGSGTTRPPLMRQRGERIERSFAHLYDTGGMRRTHLRGHTTPEAPIHAGESRADASSARDRHAARAAVPRGRGSATLAARGESRSYEGSTQSIRPTLTRMAMGTRETDQPPLWIATRTCPPRRAIRSTAADDAARRASLRSVRRACVTGRP